MDIRDTRIRSSKLSFHKTTTLNLGIAALTRQRRRDIGSLICWLDDDTAALGWVDGDIIWFNDGLSGTLQAVAFAFNGDVLVGTTDTAYRLSKWDGTIIWSDSMNAQAVGGGKVGDISWAAGNRVKFYLADGTIFWDNAESTGIPCGLDSDSSANLYHHSGTSVRKRNAIGAVQWTTAIGSVITDISANDSLVAIAHVRIGSPSRSITVLDIDGNEDWIFDTGAAIFSVKIDENTGDVYATGTRTGGRSVWAFDSSGNLLWTADPSPETRFDYLDYDENSDIYVVRGVGFFVLGHEEIEPTPTPTPTPSPIPTLFNTPLTIDRGIVNLVSDSIHTFRIWRGGPLPGPTPTPTPTPT